MKTKVQHNVFCLLSKITFLLLVLQGWFCSPVYAQPTSSTSATGGKEFYISYLHQTYGSATLQLKVVVEEACYITAKYNNQVNSYWSNWNNTLVQPGIYTDIVTYSDVVGTSTGVSSKTITLTSTKDVCVYACNYLGASSDATCVLPVPVWGTEYRLVTGPTLSSYPPAYSVVAKENNTVVTRHDNTTITLQADEAYHFYGSNGMDMTGEKISATKPVALFSGAVECYGGGGGGACVVTGSASADHTYEQVWSVDKWGKDFFAFPIKTPYASNGPNLNGGILGIVANENGTNITVSGAINGGTPLNYTLNAGGKQYVCYVMSGLTKITSDKPVMVFQNLPDAAIISIPAIDQRIMHALVAPFILSGNSNIKNHAIDLLIPAAFWSQTEIREDGALVSNATYTVTASADFPDWYTVRKDLPDVDVSIDITCPGGFLAYQSGSGNAESYGFAAGAGAYNLQNYFTIQEQATTIDTYYENTTEQTHTFDAADMIVVKRTVETLFTSVTWLINGVPYPIAENTNSMNILNFPASALAPGENFLTMAVLFQGASSDSIYTGSVWRKDLILEAEDDYLQVLTCHPPSVPAVLDVLLNDTMIHCPRNTITLTVTNGPQVPGASAIVNANNDIEYTRAAGFIGHDTLEYKAVCSGTTYTATVFITVVECPDNIVDVDCFVPLIPQDWSMAETYSNETNLSPYQSVVVGDIDGDGIVEIIAAANPVEGNVSIAALGTIYRPAYKIAIYKGNDIQSPPFVFNTTQVFTWDNKVRFGIAKTKINNQDTVLIVVAEADRRLRAYNYNGQMVWESPSANPYHASAYNGMSPTFADLNHDGIPEIAIGGRLYNSTDGSFICMIPAGHPALSYTSSTNYTLLSALIVQLADVYHDGNMKYIMGNFIYDVNIDPATNDIQSLTLNKEIIHPTTNWNADPDYVAVSASNLRGGAVLFVDMDQDGMLDMVVSVQTQVSNRSLLYVADPVSGNIKASKYITNASYGGYPFAGDMDGDGKPEIALIKGINGTLSSYRILSYKYVSGNTLLQLFWELPHEDGSSVTGLTLFDFDQDGEAELVYRDELNLRIIDGRASSPYPNRNKASMPNFSGTGAEYPVVADVDGDGQAEIIIIGADTYEDRALNGRLRVYKSALPAASPWAPTRKVWNQFAYHPLYVREDLSVPAYPMNPATFFPNATGNKQPFNNYLQQQTILNADGNTFWPAPDLIWDPAIIPPAAYTYYSNGDSLTITVHVKNQGDAAIGAPVYFTAYKDVIPGVKMGTGAYPAQIFPDSTATFTFCIEDFMSQYSPLSQIIIRLNDNDGVFPYQQECNYGDSIRVLTGIVAAKRDFAITPINQPVTIPVLNNDLPGSCNSSTIALSIAIPPLSGTTSFGAGNTIIYTPNNEFQGLDSLEYTINCSGSTSTARVYIYVYPNTSQFCTGSSTTVTIGLNSGGVNVAWYNGGVYVPTINVSSLLGSIDYPYEVRVTFPVYLGSELVTDASAIYHVKVTPLLMYWKKTATNSNWNDPSNWVTASDAALNAVPQSCTTVHIPGNANNYPSLDLGNTLRTPYYGEPECDSIFFHFGGEVAKPHLLDYNKALIEYNFGYFDNSSVYQADGDSHSALPPMERGKWYALATPLNRITPGDFSFGGKPDAWQQAFIRNNISGIFTGAWQDPDNANATDVPEEQYGGIAVWMADIVLGSIGEDASYHTNLNDLQGILRMPYFEDSYLSGQHRIHDYISGKSRFYYYYYKNPSQDIAWTIYDEIERGSESYRFVFDGQLPPTYISSAGDNFPTFKMTVPAGKELMIGNPFLSNLDFDEFYAINAGSLENDTYRLYANGGWGYHYSADGGSWPLTQYIAPLQAFFIQTSAGATELLFPPDLVSVTVPTNKLRAAGNRYSNVLYVEASNGEGSSWATLGMKEGINVDQLFNNDTLYLNVPQIYALDGNHKNAVQFVSGERVNEIPLGIRSQSAGMITLRFMNVERFYSESLELQDKVLGDIYDLLLGTNEIQFVNLPDVPDRFLLKVGKQTVGTGVTKKDSGVTVRADRNKWFVESSEIIRQIVITNMQGITIFNNPSVNTTHVTIELNVPSGIYIVKVMLENGESRVEKVIEN